MYGGRCLLYHTVFPAICAVFSMVGVSAALASASLLSTEVICALGTDAPFVV